MTSNINNEFLRDSAEKYNKDIAISLHIQKQAKKFIALNRNYYEWFLMNAAREDFIVQYDYESWWMADDIEAADGEPLTPNDEREINGRLGDEWDAVASDAWAAAYADEPEFRAAHPEREAFFERLGYRDEDDA